MNQRLFLITLVLFCFAIFYLSITQIPTSHAIASGNYNALANEQSKNTTGSDTHAKWVTNVASANKTQFLFNVTPKYDSSGKIISYTVGLSPKQTNLYRQVGFPSKSQKVAFIYPIFTQAAYKQGGFYDYYNKKCGTTCLTIPIPAKIDGGYSSSISAAMVLNLLNYSQISDVDIDTNPNILKKYSKIIVLHNEYVTQKEFDAITHHPNVIYLYPNALYALVKINYNIGTITLVKGHGYPASASTSESSIGNGFGWKYDNSKYEYDNKCDNWQFIIIPHGKMLNCYPSLRILTDQSLLHAIKN
ncbi:MAG TPA: hypothetical protein VFA69_05830 [Candidatus Nitrosotalea sp.]|nr:hypothetical protein [Candidatus Nitrosotalea sp.]